jgi:predicted AAA+ superfamily ATPase
MSKMKRESRYLSPFIKEDLLNKMVFIGGPRQVGKTTLALGQLQNGAKSHPAYLNWDFGEDRARITRGELPFNEPIIILDEIHKYTHWRNLVKGIYDKYSDSTKFIVTGSARLDYYRKGGDSLLGRYHYYRLHPFTLAEIDSELKRESLEALLKVGGFPEPLHKGSDRFYRRWKLERTQRILTEDLRDLEAVREISLVEALVDALPARIATPLSINTLSKSLEVAHETIEKWITILENLYLVYRIGPYQGGKLELVKQTKKLYFWDWCQASEGGQRNENFLASHLLKFCHFLEDTEGYKMELRYLKDVKGREIDFVILKDRKPMFGVECKTGDKEISNAIKYFSARSKIPLFYQVHFEKSDYFNPDFKCRVLPFTKFCKEIGLK